MICTYKYIKGWYICTNFSWFFVQNQSHTLVHAHTSFCQIVIACMWKKYCFGSDLCARCLLKNNFPNVATQCAPITNYKQIVSFLVHFYIWPQALKKGKIYLFIFPKVCRKRRKTSRKIKSFSWWLSKVRLKESYYL